MALGEGDGGAAQVEPEAPATAPAPPVVFTAVKPKLVLEAEKTLDAVDFYKAAFGAREVHRVMAPKRKASDDARLVLYVEIEIGPSTIGIMDLAGVDSSHDPNSKVSNSFFILETDNVDAAIAKAVAAGAKARGPAHVIDPFGNVWGICEPRFKPISESA